MIKNEYPEITESAELSEYGDFVIISFICIEEAGDFTVVWSVPLLVSEDGGTLTVLSLQGLFRYQYIDSKTESPRIYY